MKRIVAILACLLWLLACGSDSNEFAKVNGRKITKDQFNAYLKFKRIPETDTGRLNAVADEYLEREALSSVIEAEEKMDTPVIQAELNELKKEMLISRYFETFLKDAVSEQAVKNYYSAHAEEYEQKKAHVAHILIRTNKKMSETERQAKLTTAQEAYSKVRTGEDFAKVAEKYSEDKVSAKKGGDLGWMKEGSIGPVFSKTVFEMEPGTVSEPFETTFGFHVVKLLEEPKVVKQPFKSVEGNIRYQLRNKAKQAESERLMAKVKIKRNVEKDK